MQKNIGLITACFIGSAAMIFAQGQKSPKAGTFNVSEGDRVTANAFWTVDRLENAKPMALPRVDPLFAPVVDQSTAAPKGAQGFLPSGRPSVAPGNAELEQKLELREHGTSELGADVQVQPEGFNYVYPFTNYRPPLVNAYPYATVGKLFFFIPAGASQPSGTYVCSASVDINNHTLLTARHCVFDIATGTWYRNWVFYPAYNNGPNPVYHNGWTIRRAATWVTGSGWDLDIAFLQVNDDKGFGCAGSSGGHPIGYYTGWLGATWNGSYSQRQWDVFGYPQAAPFGGNHVWQDEAATGALNPFGFTNTIGIGSPQTGGTSGGPWILGFDPLATAIVPPGNNTVPNSTNLANGINSFKFTNPNQPLAINGPAFFTYNFYNLYAFYAGLSCP